jgi:hypothetical protein
VQVWVFFFSGAIGSCCWYPEDQMGVQLRKEHEMQLQHRTNDTRERKSQMQMMPRIGLVCKTKVQISPPREGKRRCAPWCSCDHPCRLKLPSHVSHVITICSLRAVAQRLPLVGQRRDQGDEPPSGIIDRG